MGHLHAFEDHNFIDITRDGLELPGEAAVEPAKKDTKAQKKLLSRLKDALVDQVADVKRSKRLTDSAAVLVLGQDDLGPQMRQIMEAAVQVMPESKPSLEVNVDHALLKRLDRETDDTRFTELARLVFDHAQLGAGGKLDDAPGYLRRVNALLIELAD